MKKIIATFAAALLLFSCTQQANIPELAADLLGQPTNQNGSVYKYENCTDKQIYKDYKTIKETIDKELGILPSEVREMEVNAENGHLYDYYQWETTDRFVSLWVEPESKFIEIIDRQK